jgi:hypothetical protein
MPQSEQPLHDESSAPEDHPRRSKWRSLGRVGEIILLAAAVLTVAGITLFSIKIATGVSRDLETPAEPIRLQIVNGSGIKDAELRLQQQLNGFTEQGLNILVVEATAFDLRKVATTYIVSRKQDDRSARALATRLGLDPIQVIFEPLENNVRSVSVSLILGDDYHRIRLTGSDQKEK